MEANEFKNLLFTKLFVSILDTLLMMIAIYISKFRDIRDEFIRRSLLLLIVATFLRVVLGFIAAF